MTTSESQSFKEDIEIYVKKIYSLILEEYGDVLPSESLDLIKNFDVHNDIIIDGGGKFSKGPGRWENATKKLHLSPELFYENSYKIGMDKDVKLLSIDDIENKLTNSANSSFTGEELANLVRQRNLTHFDITKGVVIHELFHSIIHMKTNDEVFSINFDNKFYDCRGVKGELLDEGLVEYFARRFSDKNNLFIFPSIPYQSNVDYAKATIKRLGNNADKLIFNGNYKTILNYIHDPNFTTNYHVLENDWLQPRIMDRLKLAESKDNLYDFGEVEELKLI